MPILRDCPAAQLTASQLIGYIGGIIDGEGYIGITASNMKGRKAPYKLYALCISVTMTTTEALDALRLAFKGETLSTDRSPYKIQYTWRLRKRSDVEYFVNTMSKYKGILVKAKQLELAREFLIVTRNRLQDPELREAFYQKFKYLNR